MSPWWWQRGEVAEAGTEQQGMYAPSTPFATTHGLYGWTLVQVQIHGGIVCAQGSILPLSKLSLFGVPNVHPVPVFSRI